MNNKDSLENHQCYRKIFASNNDLKMELLFTLMGTVLANIILKRIIPSHAHMISILLGICVFLFIYFFLKNKPPSYFKYLVKYPQLKKIYKTPEAPINYELLLKDSPNNKEDDEDELQ